MNNIIKIDKLSRLDVVSLNGTLDKQQVAKALQEIGVVLVTRTNNKDHVEYQARNGATAYVVNETDEKYLAGIDYLSAVPSRGAASASNRAEASTKADLIEKLVVSGVMSREQAIKFVG